MKAAIWYTFSVPVMVVAVSFSSCGSCSKRRRGKTVFEPNKDVLDARG